MKLQLDLKVRKNSLGTKPEHGPNWKNPSQELWGKASRYNGGCMDGQEEFNVLKDGLMV